MGKSITGEEFVVLVVVVVFVIVCVIIFYMGEF